jgi:hypothetical protein
MRDDVVHTLRAKVSFGKGSVEKAATHFQTSETKDNDFNFLLFFLEKIETK